MASDWIDAIVVTVNARGRFSVYGRKCGHQSEAARRQTWKTVHTVKDVHCVQAALDAVVGCAETLELPNSADAWCAGLQRLAARYVARTRKVQLNQVGMSDRSH